MILGISVGISKRKIKYDLNFLYKRIRFKNRIRQLKNIQITEMFILFIYNYCIFIISKN